MLMKFPVHLSNFEILRADSLNVNVGVTYIHIEENIAGKR